MEELFRKMKDSSGQRDFDDAYTVKQLLGSGQYGKVYAAERKKDKDLFAVKVLSRKAMYESEFENPRTEVRLLQLC